MVESARPQLISNETDFVPYRLRRFARFSRMQPF